LNDHIEENKVNYNNASNTSKKLLPTKGKITTTGKKTSFGMRKLVNQKYCSTWIYWQHNSFIMFFYCNL